MPFEVFFVWILLLFGSSQLEVVENYIILLPDAAKAFIDMTWRELTLKSSSKIEASIELYKSLNFKENYFCSYFPKSYIFFPEDDSSVEKNVGFLALKEGIIKKDFYLKVNNQIEKIVKLKNYRILFLILENNGALFYELQNQLSDFLALNGRLNNFIKYKTELEALYDSREAIKTKFMNILLRFVSILRDRSSLFTPKPQIVNDFADFLETSMKNIYDYETNQTMVKYTKSIPIDYIQRVITISSWNKFVATYNSYLDICEKVDKFELDCYLLFNEDEKLNDAGKNSLVHQLKDTIGKLELVLSKRKESSILVDNKSAFEVFEEYNSLDDYVKKMFGLIISDVFNVESIQKMLKKAYNEYTGRWKFLNNPVKFNLVVMVPIIIISLLIFFLINHRLKYNNRIE